MRRFIAVLLLVTLSGHARPIAQDVSLPSKPDSLKFAVIGDNGTGDKPQFDVARLMTAAHGTFPFELVIMLGDNLYGSQDVVSKFEKPYAALLEMGVPFIATLGNHDAPSNRNYKGFNMGGQRYFTYVRKNVRFFVLDTNILDPDQIKWAENALKESKDDWKICYFHHPLYSDAGRHGSDVELRVTLEPLLLKYGVNVVFSGHDHIYERVKPQKGITYFVEGASGQLRAGDVKASPNVAASFDQDQTFMLVEVAGDELSFQTLSRAGRTVDQGVIGRHPQD